MTHSERPLEMLETHHSEIPRREGNSPQQAADINSRAVGKKGWMDMVYNKQNPSLLIHLQKASSNDQQPTHQHCPCSMDSLSDKNSEGRGPEDIESCTWLEAEMGILKAPLGLARRHYQYADCLKICGS